MANNRIELATFPRYLENIRNKATHTASDNDLHLETNAFMLIFANDTELMDSTGSTDFPERIPANTIAMVTGGTNPNSLYRYVHGADRSGDSWSELTQSSTIEIDTLTQDSTTDPDTTFNRYQLSVGGTNVGSIIPVATWAQNSATTELIPRSKLPDMSYGERVYYAAAGADGNNNRNANASGAGFSDAGLTNAITGRITWHQNDVAIVVDVMANSQAAYLYVGNTQTTPDVTTDGDWFQIGNTVTLSPINRFITSLSLSGDSTANTSTGALRYSVQSANSPTNTLDLGLSGFMVDANVMLSVNGVLLIRGIDYTIGSGNTTVAFTNLPLANGDSLHFFGNSLS